jgi:LacI family transcriptional regulator
MPTTLTDIANATGFSITTVSRALAGYSDVSPRTKELIRAYAEQTGYSPNHVARQLQGRKTRAIGFIVRPDQYTPQNDFFSMLIHGMSYAVARFDYDLLVSTVHTPEDEMAHYQRIVGGHRVDGVVVARTAIRDVRLEYLRARSAPFVVAGRQSPLEPSDFPFVDLDSQAGIRMVVDHFVERGHRRIGIILPPPQLAFTGFRLLGYQDGLSQAGIAFDEALVRNGDMTIHSGYALAREILEASGDVTALIASNDLMAIGAMRAINDRGLTVGQDIAVSGFDDIDIAQYTDPPLTSVHQPIYDIASELIALLVGVIDEHVPRDAQHSRVIPPKLVIRASSGVGHH